MGGLSLGALALFSGLGRWGHPDPAPGLAWWLGWVINWPHFSASSYRLYHSRGNLLQYPVTALAIPVLIGAGAVGALLAPLTAGAALVKLFFLWSPYHFTGQSVGLSLIYARRAGMDLGRVERWAISAFLWATYVCLILRQEAGTGSQALLGVLVPRLGVPAWTVAVGEWTTGLLGLLLLAVFLRSSRAAGRALPLIILLPSVTQGAWLLGSNLPAYQALVPMFHSLQYLLVAWAMQLGERREASRQAPSSRFVRWESLRWALVNFLGGAALFWFLPRAVAGGGGVPLEYSIPILSAAVQIHHFFVDGVIWKLRDPRVRAPLLAEVGELAGAASGGARGTG